MGLVIQQAVRRVYFLFVKSAGQMWEPSQRQVTGDSRAKTFGLQVDDVAVESNQNEDKEMSYIVTLLCLIWIVLFLWSRCVHSVRDSYIELLENMTSFGDHLDKTWDSLTWNSKTMVGSRLQGAIVKADRGRGVRTLEWGVGVWCLKIVEAVAPVVLSGGWLDLFRLLSLLTFWSIGLKKVSSTICQICQILNTLQGERIEASLEKICD